MLQWVGSGFEGRRYGPQLHSKVSLNGVLFALGEFVKIPDQHNCNYVICEITKLYEAHNGDKLLEGRIYLFPSQTMIASNDKWELYQTSETIVQFIRRIDRKCSVLLLNAVNANPAAAKEYYARFNYNKDLCALSNLRLPKMPRFFYDGTNDFDPESKPIVFKGIEEEDKKSKGQIRYEKTDTEYTEQDDTPAPAADAPAAGETTDEEDEDLPERKEIKKGKIQIIKPKDLQELRDTIIGRQLQKDEIKSYVESCLESPGGSRAPLFIGGGTGYGKTSTVLFVMNEIWETGEYKFNFISINLSQLLRISQVYSLLWKQISGKLFKRPKTAMKYLQAYFAYKKRHPEIKTIPLIVLLDETDNFTRNPASQTILYNLLELSLSINSRLILIMISTSAINMIDNILDKRIVSRMSRNITFFQSYNKQELLEIIGSKKKYESIPKNILNTIAFDVSRQHGDVRAAFQKCNKIVDLQKKGNIIDLEYKSHIPSAYPNFIHSLTKYEKIALWSICNEYKLMDVEEKYFMPMFKVILAIIHKCKSIGITPLPSDHDINRMLYRLSQIRIIEIIQDHLGEPLIRLNRNCESSLIRSVYAKCDFWNRLLLPTII